MRNRTVAGTAKTGWSWRDSWRDNVLRSRITSLVRLFFSVSILIFYYREGTSDLVLLQSLHLAFSIGSTTLLWLPALTKFGGRLAEVAAGGVPGFLRTYSDVLQIALFVHSTGGNDSPILVGFALPVVLSSFGNSRWRGRSAAILASLCALASELVSSMGWAPDTNIFGRGPTPSTAAQMFWFSTSVMITLVVAAEVTNRLYSATLKARLEATRLLEEATKARADSDQAREQAELTARRLAELTESAREVNASTDLDKILDRVFDRIQASCNVDYFGMYLVDNEKQELYGSHHRSADSGPAQAAAFYGTRLSLNTRSLMMLSIKRGRAAYIPDLNQVRLTSEEKTLMENLKLKSMMYVPLYVGQELVGVINFSLYNRPMNLTPDQVAFVGAFGQQIAGAVKHATLLNETELARTQAEAARISSERERRNIEKLNEFSKALNASTDFRSTIGQIVSYMQSEFGIDSSFLLLPDARSGELVTSLSFTLDSTHPFVQERVHQTRIPVGPEGGIVRKAYDRKKPLYIRVNGKRDIFARPYPGMEHDRDLITSIGLEWFFLLPLVVQDNAIGMLLVTSFTKPAGLELFEIKSVERFSDQVAGAVHTSNLLDQIKHERDRAEAARGEVETSRAETELLADLARRANEGRNLDEILQAAKDVVGNKLGADTMVLWLVDAPEENLLLRSHITDPEIVPRLDEVRTIPLQPGSGVLYRTFKRGRILALDRIEAEWLATSPVDAAVVRAINMKWFLHAPLKVDGRVIGIMAMTGPDPRRLTKQETQFIERIAAQIAGAVRTQELLRAAEEGRREVAAMAEFTRRVNESSDLELIIQDIAKYVVETMNLSGASLALVNDNRTELYNGGGYRKNTTPEQEEYFRKLKVPLTPESGTLYLTYRRGKTLYLTSFGEPKSPVDQHLVQIFKVKSFVQVPLKVGDEVLGILTLDPGETKLGQREIKKLETFVGQIAGAVHTARLLQATTAANAASEKAREETALLADIARKANEGHNIDEILISMFEILERRYGADSLALYTLDAKTNAMVMRASLQGGRLMELTTYPDPVRAIPMSPSGGTMFRTFKKQKIFYINRIDPAWLAGSPVDAAVVRSFGSTWFVQVPLIVDGRVIGCFPFTGKAGSKITKEDLQFVERISAQIAGAVRALELVRETEVARADSERLLYNILPRSVAEELKRAGRVEPLFYDSVSVLFTDFVGFTQASATMLPDELIEELDGCFSQFDEVVKRNNMEKLKTIGDAYMAASGLPALSPTHALDACLTALEFRSFMVQMAAIKESLGHPFWRLRIGIHSGPVTAGVVGTNKFAYDIWGDTVNTASRMESSGQADHINISGDTHDLVKDFFDCEYRGKVMAKGKGEMDMYFLHGIKPDLAADAERLLPNAKFEMMRMSLVPQI